MEVNKIIHGDCFEVLKDYPDNFFDSIVTDPPAGINFMCKDWDKDKGGRENWIEWMSSVAKECLRVLKPGGHALVWAIPRTSHWTGTAWENAGWECRDKIYHCFGSGFPKSLNVGKAIDKLEGNEREVIGENGVFSRSQSSCYAQDKWTLEQIGKPVLVTKGNSEWEGWGTALKPAIEEWWLFRKPLSESTVAKNVLIWGTGAINIDDCRVGVETRINKRQPSYQGATGTFSGQGEIPNRCDKVVQGRFPANFIHDGSDEVIELFPENDYTSKRKNKIQGKANWFGGAISNEGLLTPDYPEKGSASRFFYCAKASPSERNMGCENKHPTVKPIKLMSYLVRLITPPNGVVLDCFGGSGTTAIACIEENKNYVLIEREKEYIDIAEARIHAVNKDRQLQLDVLKC